MIFTLSEADARERVFPQAHPSSLALGRCYDLIVEARGDMPFASKDGLTFYTAGQLRSVVKKEDPTQPGWRIFEEKQAYWFCGEVLRPIVQYHEITHLVTDYDNANRTPSMDSATQRGN